MQPRKSRRLHHLYSATRTLWKQGKEYIVNQNLEPFPLKGALKSYVWRDATADFRAGTNVALLAFCQGLAYAAMAGLPLVYGVMCAAIAAMVGPLLSSSRHTVLGPTNGSAFMIFSFFTANPEVNMLQQMPMLVFLTGAILIIGAYFRVADLAQYISRTVIVAYITGAALMIACNQGLVLLGIQKLAQNSAENTRLTGTFFGALWQIFTHLGSVKPWGLLTGVGSAICYFCFRKWRPTWPAFAISLIVGALLGLAFKAAGCEIVTFSDATFGWYNLLPPFPAFVSTEAATQFSQLFSLALAVAFVSNLENSVMSTSLASRANYRVDQNQDMLSLGVSNLACAYLSGMPASGSLTRSALNFESGARSPLASMVSGFLCLLAALTLGGLVAYIPKAALAALVISVAVSLIHRRQIRISLRATKSDALVFIVTFAATLMVPLNVAIFTGVGLAVMLYIRKASQPTLVEYTFNEEGHLAELENQRREHPSISIVHVEGDLFFGAADLFRTQIQRTCADPNLKIIILRLKNARHLDATSVMALEELIRVMRQNGRDLIVSGAMKDVYRVLRNSGLIDFIGRDNIFLGSTVNPNLSTRHALQRAQQILGVKTADVHIYYDPRHQKSGGGAGA